MNSSEAENANYIPVHQSLIFENCEKDSKPTQQKLLIHKYTASLKLLSTQERLQFLKFDLNHANVYNGPVLNVECRNEEFCSNLDNIDLSTILKPLPCSSSYSYGCSKTKTFSQDNLDQFCSYFVEESIPKVPKFQQNTIPKTRKIAKCFAPQTCGRKDSNVAFKRVEPMQDLPPFRTALEELQIQNAKKQDSTTSYTAPTIKKTLGIRRTANDKFVSPVISASEYAALQQSRTVNDEIIDERLKNIDPKMVELIRSEIMDTGVPVSWDDIAGLHFAKSSIQEAVVWPLLRPDIFTGLRKPPKGILLFGPPGTGKTLIGKCVASQSKSTFFSISASSLTSKWIGDGEKMVRALFAVARCHQPAVIFIDEIDSLLSQRSDTEHESSRRIKTEFLVQLDGATTDNEDRILVIGATNRPQELDEAARRRFVKRLYIPLPEYEARLELVKKLMSSERNVLTESDLKEITNMSSGYSGADMKNLCSEACLGPIRSIDMCMMQTIQAGDVRPVNMDDFTKAFTRVRASVSSKDLNQYVTWNETFGAGI